MLFDLRGRGRRRSIQAIYLSLAILMGGGLVLFGIGGATSGGLIDAVSGGGSTSVDNSVYEKRIADQRAKVKANPKNARAWADLTRAQVQQASVRGYDQETGGYNKEGIKFLTAAGVSWDRYLELNPKKRDAGVAALMVSAFGPGALNEPARAARALDVVISERGGSAALYTQSAVLHYQAGDVRRSVLAEKQALRRTPERRRKIVKARLAAQRTQIDQVRLTQATGGEGDIEINPDTSKSPSKTKTNSK